MTLALLVLLSQAQPVVIKNPSGTSTVTTTTNNGKVLLDVNCPTCTGGGAGGSSGSSLVYVVDAGPPINVNPVAISSLPLVFVQDAGVLNVQGPLTDTQLRATAVPISGTVTASGPVTDTQLRASAVPVSLASMPSTPVTGTFFQATQPVSAVALPLPTGAATDSTLSQLFDGGVNVRIVSQVALNPYPLNPFLPRCNPVRRTGCQP